MQEHCNIERTGHSNECNKANCENDCCKIVFQRLGGVLAGFNVNGVSSIRFKKYAAKI